MGRRRNQASMASSSTTSRYSRLLRLTRTGTATDWDTLSEAWADFAAAADTAAGHGIDVDEIITGVHAMTVHATDAPLLATRQVIIPDFDRWTRTPPSTPFQD